MKKIKPSNENEMVYEFLKMEIDSKRFRNDITKILDELHIAESKITDGNINSDYENNLRAEVLRRFRGWRDSEMFEDFPIEINWLWTVFDNDDMKKIHYIIYSYWNELSDYTGSPLEAGKTILSGKKIYGLPNDDFINGAEMLRNGHKFPPFIFLTDYEESRYIILEGHSRMTAYGLVPDMFHNIHVLLGYCHRDELNKWYGIMPKKER